MRKFVMLLTVALLCFSASAQDIEQGFRNSVKLSLQPLLTACPVVSYERAFPRAQSVELTVGGHCKLPLLERLTPKDPFNQVLFAQMGYKYTFAQNPSFCPNTLIGGWYVKGFVGINRFWRSLDCFVGNQGQDIFTENRTFHATTVSYGAVIGRQFVMASGFMIDFFAGLSIPQWYFGPESWKNYCRMNYTYSSLLYFTQGVRLGWCF